jgi:putative Mg2+ transporter-C (MgtC) family protein
MNNFAVEVEPLVRILAALALGAIVGFEREANDQAAGLRTHISVALGACVFGIVSTLGFEAFERTTATNVAIDVTRVASQVVVGIGFIGAGVIFRQGLTARGVTTAASLWVTAAIGLAVGIGAIGLAFVATVGLVATLVVLRLPRRWIRDHITRTTHEIQIRLESDADPQAIIQALRSLSGFDIRKLQTEKHHGSIVLRVTLEADPRVGAVSVLDGFAARGDVADVRVIFERQTDSD